jgi:hypothetical protein
MARFQSPPENAVQVPLTRRRVVLLFIVQVVLLGATFLLGFWVGRGQRHLEEQLSTSVTPPPVITEPGPPVAPVEEPKPSPSPSAGPTPLGTDDKASFPFASGASIAGASDGVGSGPAFPAVTGPVFGKVPPCPRREASLSFKSAPIEIRLRPMPWSRN